MTLLTDAPLAIAPAVALAADRLEIVVSLADIEDGTPQLARWCAVAIALRRAGHASPYVSHRVVSVGPRGARRRYVPSLELDAWISAFDNVTEVHPERFVLEPAPVQARREASGAAA